jgi:uncharacterized protein (DUF433 family)
VGIASMLQDRAQNTREAPIMHERITIDPNIRQGKPVIRRTRITVELILRKLGAGMTTDDIIADPRV